MSWQYVNSISWIVSAGEDVIGVCVRFGAPSMQSLYGLSLAWHWQVDCGHVHLRNQYGIVCYGGLLLRVSELINVRNLVFLLGCSVCVMR